MFRRDNTGRFVETDNFHPKFSGGDWLRNHQWMRFFRSGGFRAKQLTREQHTALVRSAKSRPILVMQPEGTRKRWWMFRGEFYWEDEGLDSKDVEVLILDRIEQDRKKVRRAKARMS